MPGNRPHHTDKWRSCVEQVMAKGHDEQSASAICTKSLQDAGEPIFEGAAAGSPEEIKLLAEFATGTLETLHLCGATGRSRTEWRDGKEYLVVPIVALMEGVIHPVNANTPEFVPLSTLKRAASSWNGRPITLGHPTREGKQCSANDPTIFESHVIGTVFNSHVEGTKLLQEAWVEKAKTRKLHPQMFDDLAADKSIEVSVGTFVVTSEGPGEFNKKPYKATWLEANGDHLAFLPGGRGACSREMGCGTHRAAEMAPMHFVAAESIEYDSFLDAGLRFLAAVKMIECEACKGTGSKDGNPCEVCNGEGELKAAAGARNSATDMEMIQAVHDHAAKLGAVCDRRNLETAAEATIRNEGGKWLLFSKDGSRKLAEHATRKDAEDHAQAIIAAMTRHKT
jgi:hypothetical protein